MITEAGSGINMTQMQRPQRPESPPGGNVENRPPPPPPPPSRNDEESTELNMKALSAFSDILKEYQNLQDLSFEEQAELGKVLQASGLLDAGSLFSAKV